MESILNIRANINNIQCIHLGQWL